MNRTKDAELTVGPTNVEKAFDRTQDPFFIKTLHRFGTERHRPDVMRAACDEPTADRMLGDDRKETKPPALTSPARRVPGIPAGALGAGGSEIEASRSERKKEITSV